MQAKVGHCLGGLAPAATDVADKLEESVGASTPPMFSDASEEKEQKAAGACMQSNQLTLNKDKELGTTIGNLHKG